MTRPERILNQLTEIDPDRACAVVKVTEAVVGTGKGPFKPVETSCRKRLGRKLVGQVLD